MTAYSLRTGVTTNQRTVNDDRLARATTASRRPWRSGTPTASRIGRRISTYSCTRVDLTSLATPNSLINAAGESGGRRHQFKMSGWYMLPYDILFGGNFLWQSGLPSIARSPCSSAPAR